MAVTRKVYQEIKKFKGLKNYVVNKIIRREKITVVETVSKGSHFIKRR